MNRLKTPKARLDAGRAEALAAEALAYLAEDPGRLIRFMRETGIGPDELRASAGSLETAIAVLDYLLSDESLLLVFTSEKGLNPETVAPALQLLQGKGFDRGSA
jgi:hypothetical protein